MGIRAGLMGYGQSAKGFRAARAVRFSAFLSADGLTPFTRALEGFGDATSSELNARLPPGRSFVVFWDGH